jgi:hypothetical protein
VLLLFVTSISLTLVCTPTIVVKGQEEAYRLGVYFESSCIYPFRFDYWALNRGDTKNVTAYLRNDGTENVTEITTATWYWSPPSAVEYVGLTLDCGNQFLQPSNVTDATFTIHAYENASLGSFTFFLNVSAHYGAVIFTKLFILSGYIAEPHPKFCVFGSRKPYASRWRPHLQFLGLHGMFGRACCGREWALLGLHRVQRYRHD